MRKTGLLVLGLTGLFGISQAVGATITEDFSINPLEHGWKIFGDTNLFQWDSTNRNLRVTWNSAQPNSYFYRLLGTILTRADDFTIAFDLELTDIGPAPGLKTNNFEVALGFLNLDQATRTNFLRGTGTDSPNLAEIDYFWPVPGSAFGQATFWPTFIDTNSAFNYNSSSDYAIFELATNDWYHIVMSYTASNQTVTATVTNFENTSGARITQLINTNFADYRLGGFSISSYDDAGQAPQYAGSVLADGVVDNLMVTVPDPPVSAITGMFFNGTWQVEFNGRTNWFYTLERTRDFESWVSASATVPGNEGKIVLTDINPPATAVSYRVRANRP